MGLVDTLKKLSVINKTTLFGAILIGAILIGVVVSRVTFNAYEGDGIAFKPGSRDIVQVLYGTDRKGSGPDKSRGYSDNRGDFEYGIAYVGIPENHKPGELERPLRFLSIELQEKAKDHVIILRGLQRLTKEQFLNELRWGMRYYDDPVFIFIHGYNVSFEEAILRTGQLSFDLKLTGPAVSYSWPSKGKTKDYLTDGEQIKLTKPHLKRFLTDIRQISGKRRICILAHSMGNRAFTKVLVELAGEIEKYDGLFDQIILAAPDIDAEVFKTEIAPNIKGTANQITLYASSKDNVLELSSSARDDRPRAGQAGESIVIVDGIDTVDASSTNDGFFSFLKSGHSYYGDDLLIDMHSIIKNGLKPDNRFLKKVASPSGNYWAWDY